MSCFRTCINRGSVEYPPDTETASPPAPTAGENATNETDNDTEGNLYSTRIDRFISDDVSTTPLSPVEESKTDDGGGGKDSSTERILAKLNEFETAFAGRKEGGGSGK